MSNLSLQVKLPEPGYIEVEGLQSVLHGVFTLHRTDGIHAILERVRELQKDTTVPGHEIEKLQHNMSNMRSLSDSNKLLGISGIAMELKKHKRNFRVEEKMDSWRPTVKFYAKSVQDIGCVGSHAEKRHLEVSPTATDDPIARDTKANNLIDDVDATRTNNNLDNCNDVRQRRVDDAPDIAREQGFEATVLDACEAGVLHQSRDSLSFWRNVKEMEEV